MIRNIILVCLMFTCIQKVESVQHNNHDIAQLEIYLNSVKFLSCFTFVSNRNILKTRDESLQKQF